MRTDGQYRTRTSASNSHSGRSRSRRAQSGPRAVAAGLQCELRGLAARKLARQAPGHTLQPTALVHEAYLRLVGGDRERSWDSRGHFYAAAAEAMRRILLDRARDKKRLKRGGGRGRSHFDVNAIFDDDAPPDDLIDLDEALTRLDAA